MTEVDELEIVIPGFNTAGLLAATLESLSAQTDRAFSVLVSHVPDEAISKTVEMLESSGIRVRLLTRETRLHPTELWNWTLFQSEAKWLKPLETGDRLAPNFVARLREAIGQFRDARVVFACHECRRGSARCRDLPTVRFLAAPQWRADLRSGAQAVPVFSAAAFDREALAAVGGLGSGTLTFSKALFACSLAASFGAAVIAKPLCEAGSLHQDLSMRESLAAMTLRTYHAWTENDVLPRSEILGSFWRALRSRCAH